MKKTMIFRSILSLFLVLTLLPGAFSEIVSQKNAPESPLCPEESDYVSLFGKIDYDRYYEDMNAWSEYFSSVRLEKNEADGLITYFSKTAREFLLSDGDKNAVYSPLNLYFALGMLAEITDGETRQQILSLLGHEDIDTLRTEAGRILNASYRDEGAQTCLFAASVWLNKLVSFKEETLKNVSAHYFADAFSAEMGAHQTDAALRAWINENTKNLLSESVKDLSLDADTVIALVTSVYFSARWSGGFSENATYEEIFHSVGGDISCDFMHKNSDGTAYFGKNFLAAEYAFENGGGMWFFLPDEGVSPETLLSDDALIRTVMHPEEFENQKRLLIRASVPKFDVSKQTDLIAGLKNLGVINAFNENLSDFTPLCDDSKNLEVSKAQHDARVIIDEEGALAAAYTIISVLPTSAMPPADEIEFRLDRPFVFVISTADDLPLFIGIVNAP